MTATVEAPDDAPKITVSGERLRFYSPDEGRLVWKAWTAMTDAEKAVVREKFPSFVPDDEKTGDVGRYADLIEYYTEQLQRAQRTVREGRTDIERGHAAGAVVQFRQAIENLREAELIEAGTEAWFAVIPGEVKSRIAPVFGASSPYYGDSDPSWFIQTVNHVARLSNPIHIAWMRRLMRTGVGQNREVHELEFDPSKPLDKQPLYPLIDTDSGELISWGTREAYDRGVASRRFRE